MMEKVNSGVTAATARVIHGSFTLPVDLTAAPSREEERLEYRATFCNIVPDERAVLACTGDGAQDVAHLKGGTRLQFNGLAAVLG